MRSIDVIRLAREQLSEITGLPFDTVSRCTKEEDGWIVDIELIEMRRIPNSCDLLGTYQLRLDADGNLVSYQRTNRYQRGAVE